MVIRPFLPMLLILTTLVMSTMSSSFTWNQRRFFMTATDCQCKTGQICERLDSNSMINAKVLSGHQSQNRSMLSLVEVRNNEGGYTCGLMSVLSWPIVVIDHHQLYTNGSCRGECHKCCREQPLNEKQKNQLRRRSQEGLVLFGCDDCPVTTLETIGMTLLISIVISCVCMCGCLIAIFFLIC